MVWGGGGGADLCRALYPKRTTLAARLQSPCPKFVDFVQYLLTINPLERPTAAQALEHPFIVDAMDEELAGAFREHPEVID